MTPRLPICSAPSYELTYCPDEGVASSYTPAPVPQRSDDVASSRLGSVPSSTTLHLLEGSRRNLDRVSPGSSGDLTADLAAPSTHDAIRITREGIAAAREAMASSAEGSGDLATMSLLQAHDTLETLIANPAVGDHAVVERLQQRYFSALRALPAAARTQAGEKMMSILDHFEVSHEDGSSTEIYSDHRVEIEAPIELDVSEGAHVDPASVIVCDRVGEATVEERPDGSVITIEPSVICTVVPPQP